MYLNSADHSTCLPVTEGQEMIDYALMFNLRFKTNYMKYSFLN